MNQREAMDAVAQQRAVAARCGDGSLHGEGVAIAYSMVPTVTIRRPDGSEFSWRHDMTETVIEETR